MSCISVIETDVSECSEPEYFKFSKKNRVSLQFSIADSKENINDVQVNNDLNESQTDEVSSLLQELVDVFTDIPGTTDIVEREIFLT